MMFTVANEHEKSKITRGEFLEILKTKGVRQSVYELVGIRRIRHTPINSIFGAYEYTDETFSEACDRIQKMSAELKDGDTWQVTRFYFYENGQSIDYSNGEEFYNGIRR